MLLVRTIAAADVTKAAALVRGAGPAVVAIGLPYVAAIVLDTLAFATLFRVLARRVSLVRLFGVRLAGEAVTMSLPAGAVFAESINPALLSRRCGVPAQEGVAGMAARKWLQMRAHAVYIAASAVVGFGVLAATSRALLHAPGLPFVVLASAVVPLALSVAMSTAFLRGSLAERLFGLLRRAPLAPLRAWLDARQRGFRAADTCLAAFGARAGRPIATATLLYLAAWLMESLETLVILRALGAPIGFVDVMAFEAGLSLVRCLAFFAPSGLGVQDLGYVAFFSALGLPEAAALGAAFVVLKRAKEIFWIAVGYALLFFAGGRASAAPAEATP